jgi:hypothetical protein
MSEKLKEAPQLPEGYGWCDCGPDAVGAKPEAPASHPAAPASTWCCGVCGDPLELEVNDE